MGLFTTQSIFRLFSPFLSSGRWRTWPTASWTWREGLEQGELGLPKRWVVCPKVLFSHFHHISYGKVADLYPRILGRSREDYRWGEAKPAQKSFCAQKYLKVIFTAFWRKDIEFGMVHPHFCTWKKVTGRFGVWRSRALPQKIILSCFWDKM